MPDLHPGGDPLKLHCMVRYTIHFTGHVQGVGFRYTTTHIARRYNVAGYVQNLPDGRVKLVVEGDRDEVESMIDAVKDSMGRFVRESMQEQSAATGEFGQPGSPDTFAVHY